MKNSQTGQQSNVFPGHVERWNVFEVTLVGPMDGNPFVDCELFGTFTHHGEQKIVPGFYDGNGLFKVRFMPSFEGNYSFFTVGNFPEASSSGVFIVTPPRADNHGIVRARGYHFEYEDGNTYYPVGTTCYAWTLQQQAIREKTLETLSNGFFNKIRFCVFPKHYLYNINEPAVYPFEGKPCSFNWDGEGNFYEQMRVHPGNDWDLFRPNPVYFQLIEDHIAALCRLGIQADIILFHPYDRWGFSEMTPQQDEHYLRYVLARFSAYENVWWSLANEYDLLRTKSVEDWERIARFIVDNDPYGHLRSIHNCVTMYDYSRPWVTHCSIQRQDLYKCAEYTNEFRTRYGKPVVLDEIAYEGDIDQGWGNISGEELVRRFWEASIRGGYATHGETYDRGDDLLWWSHGYELRGDSTRRLAFLSGILQQTPGPGLKMRKGAWDEISATVEGTGDSGYYLYYYGFNRPFRRMFSFSPEVRYHAEVIDTWEMKITYAGIYSGNFEILLPRKQWMAIRLRRID